MYTKKLNRIVVLKNVLPNQWKTKNINRNFHNLNTYIHTYVQKIQFDCLNGQFTVHTHTHTWSLHTHLYTGKKFSHTPQMITETLNNTISLLEFLNQLPNCPNCHPQSPQPHCKYSSHSSFIYLLFFLYLVMMLRSSAALLISANQLLLTTFYLLCI